MVLQQTKPKKNNLDYYNLNADKWWQEGEVLRIYLISDRENSLRSHN